MSAPPYYVVGADNDRWHLMYTSINRDAMFLLSVMVCYTINKIRHFIATGHSAKCACVQHVNGYSLGKNSEERPLKSGGRRSSVFPSSTPQVVCNNETFYLCTATIATATVDKATADTTVSNINTWSSTSNVALSTSSSSTQVTIIAVST